MPRPRSAMRKGREVLRLHQAEHLSARQVGISVGLPRTTVRHYLDRARETGLGLEERLVGRAAPPPAIPARPVPDWAVVHRELRRKGVMLMLLWTEYREQHPDGLRLLLVRRALPRVRGPAGVGHAARP